MQVAASATPPKSSANSSKITTRSWKSPAFRGIVSADEFDSLGEDFEKKEDELFGDDGFFKIVDRVAQLEKNSASTI